MHLVTLQFSLGLATWVVKYGWPAWMDRWGFSAGWVIPEKTFWQTGLVTMHVATGSLILAAWMVVALRSWRITEAAPAEHPAAPGIARPGGSLS
jgi:cytochrome c oxidase assembly protein subunit 15